MKMLSILIPCYNEQGNVVPMGIALSEMLARDLAGYDYEIIFIDNDSTDGTRPLLRLMCERDLRIKAIFNAKNFGQFNSPYYGMLQASGNCVIVLCCDFQDPIELIPRFVHEWENGAKIVTGIKSQSDENRILRILRTSYYKLIKKMSHVELIEHFTGFGLYDRSFINILRDLHDPIPFLRGIVAEIGFDRVDVPYRQANRRAGTTHNNWYSLFDAAMLSFTSYTKIGLRIATLSGSIVSAMSFAVAAVYLVYKLTHWYTFQAGMAPLVIGVFLLGALQLFFIGFLGEYIMSINARLMNRPLVIEEERINFKNTRPSTKK